MNKPIREGFVDSPAPPRPRPTVARAGDPPEPTADQAAGQATDQAAEWPITVRLLHRPTRNNKNEEIRELVFREPTGGDINRYGNPCRVDQQGDVIFDEKKMTMMISALSGVLLPFIEAIDPRDWNSCAYRLRGFFLPDPAAW